MVPLAVIVLRAEVEAEPLFLVATARPRARRERAPDATVVFEAPENTSWSAGSCVYRSADRVAQASRLRSPTYLAGKVEHMFVSRAISRGAGLAASASPS
jgi:hypothetical protein